MSDEIRGTIGDSHPRPARKPHWALSLLIVAVALLGLAGLYYLALPSPDPRSRALLAWQHVPAPDFFLTNLDGQPIHLANLKGKRVILNFWATWCAPCQQEIPHFVKLRKTTSPTNVAIIGISTDDAATQRAFAKQHGLNYPLAVLSKAPSPYQDVVLIPTTMVIDRNGIIQNVLIGPQNFASLQKYAAEPDFSGTVKNAPVN